MIHEEDFIDDVEPVAANWEVLHCLLLQEHIRAQQVHSDTQWEDLLSQAHACPIQPPPQTGNDEDDSIRSLMTSLENVRLWRVRVKVSSMCS